ncbi:MAG: hypothetical protein M3O25_08480 [Actinomycetota bacterium]|nr:hypothetical protein [Actinomycetota bacterium]
MSEAGALVFGFSDEATQLAGVAWSIAGESGALVVKDGELGASGAEVAYEQGKPRARVKLGTVSCEAELSPSTSELPLRRIDGATLSGEPAAAICTAAIRLSGPGSGRDLDCAGHLTRWSADPTRGVGLLRHLTIPTSAEGLIVLLASRDEGGTDHASEHTAAWLLDSSGEATPFKEALLSTQYDEAGLTTRAGLELWPTDSDAQALRAAASRPVYGAGAGGPGASGALLHSSADGSEGIGGYLLWRR